MMFTRELPWALNRPEEAKVFSVHRTSNLRNFEKGVLA